MQAVRNSAKAIIIKGGRLLAMKARDRLGTYYLLPGGGQKTGETLHDALKRECREEISAEIKIGRLRLVREYIGANHEFAGLDGGFHQIEFMFICRLKDGKKPAPGKSPDKEQTGCEWLHLSRINSYRIYPKALKKIIAANRKITGPVYLGDAN